MNSFGLPSLLTGIVIGVLTGILLLFVWQPAIELVALFSILLIMLAYGQSRHIKVILFPPLELKKSTAFPADVQTLLNELNKPATKPPRRLEIGDQLAKQGDPRPGIGIDDKGLPDIDWVKIPAGQFIYGEQNETQNLDTFYISRYPVTHSQYQAFIDDDGYQLTEYWKDLEQPVTQSAKWAQSNRPRENVNWYEAVAFCRWLSQRLGIMVELPTEQQWEKAARGSKGKNYPWGDKYLPGYANTNEKGSQGGGAYLKQTCAVGLYPQGASPYQVMDMVGNIWEWCLNEYNDTDNINIDRSWLRVLRGGSWINDPEFARAAFRDGYDPGFRGDLIGFRVVCSLPFTEH